LRNAAAATEVTSCTPAACASSGGTPHARRRSSSLPSHRRPRSDDQALHAGCNKLFVGVHSESCSTRPPIRRRSQRVDPRCLRPRSRRRRCALDVASAIVEQAAPTPFLLDSIRRLVGKRRRVLSTGRMRALLQRAAPVDADAVVRALGFERSQGTSRRSRRTREETHPLLHSQCPPMVARSHDSDGDGACCRQTSLVTILNASTIRTSSHPCSSRRGAFSRAVLRRTALCYPDA